MTYEAHAADWTSSDRFDFKRANSIISGLLAECQSAEQSFGSVVLDSSIRIWADVRYARQIWELEVPISTTELRSQQDLDRLHADFDRLHNEVFAVQEPETPLEFVGWGARLACRVSDGAIGSVVNAPAARPPVSVRQIYLPGAGSVQADVWRLDNLPVGAVHVGPAIVESPVTTIVISTQDSFTLKPDGTLVVYTGGANSAAK
jgi:N-methylhydantoinase A